MYFSSVVLDFRHLSYFMCLISGFSANFQTFQLVYVINFRHFSYFMCLISEFSVSVCA